MPETAAPSPSRRRLAVLLLVLLPTLAYLNALPNGFVHDDVPQVLENPGIRSLRNLPELFTEDVWHFTSARRPGMTLYWRPLFLVSYAVDHAVWGVRALGYHLTNLLLHVLVTLLLFRWLRVLRLPETLSLAAALLFSLHPVNTETVDWIASRHQLLCAAFLLGAMLQHERARTSGRAGPAAAVLLLQACAVLSWEMAVITPLLLLLRELSDGGGRPPWKALLVRVGPSVLLAAAYLALRQAVVGQAPPIPLLEHPRAYAPALLSAVALYARLLLLPHPLSGAYALHLDGSLLDPPALLGALLLAGAALAGWRLLRSPGDPDSRGEFRAPPGTVALWILLPLLPVLNVGSFGPNLAAERYLYLPSMGFAVLLAASLDRLCGGRSRRTAVAVALVLAAYAGAVVARNPVWRDNRTFYEATLPQSNSPLLANNLGVLLLDEGDREKALSLFQRALELDPTYEDAHLNIGTLHMRGGDLDGAEQSFLRAAAGDPRWPNPWFSLGEVARLRGDLKKARRCWLAAIERDPLHSPSRNGLGALSLLEGDPSTAREHLSAAVEGDPDNVEAVYNLALACEALGDLPGARSLYRRFAEGADPAKFGPQVEAARSKLEEESGR